MPSSSNAPNPKYNAENFIYNSDNDCYICPQGHEMRSNGTWYKRDAAQFRQFKTPKCKSCPVRSECTTSVRNGKIIQRSEFQHYIEQNKERVALNQNYYRRRQAIVEHPYGTIKRQWGFSYIMTKRTMKRASADVGFIFTAYNLRRILNIIGIEAFRSYLLAFFAVLGSVLASIALFWRDLKYLLHFSFQKMAFHRMDLMPTLAGQFCNKIE